MAISSYALCTIVALGGGLLGGATTVHGLRLNGYGNDAPTRPAINRDADLVSAECSDCSERSLGYRWAAIRAIASPLDCPNDSWDFRRGCLDFTGGV